MPSFMMNTAPAGLGTDAPSLPLPSAQPMPALSWTAALMAHEIRAPIGAVCRLVELLDEHWHSHIPPVGMVLWEALQSEVQLLHSLSEAMLDLAHAEYARPVTTWVDVDALVRGLVDRLATAHPHTRIEVEPLGHVEADEGMLVSLWSKLLCNALKYSQLATSPHVRVQARHLAGMREFSVSDNGPGIPEDQAELVFEPFNHHLGGRSIDGHGLGLATVRAIAQAHGGDAWATAHAERGAEIRFRLPHPTRVG